MFLDTVLEAWSPYVARVEALGFDIRVKRSDEHGKLGIELESSGLVGLVSAWEHAQCLDFEYLRLPEKEGGVLFAGSCDGAAELEARLEAVLELIQDCK